MLLVSQVMTVAEYEEKKFGFSDRELHYLTLKDKKEYKFLINRRIRIPDIRKGDFVQVVFEVHLNQNKKFLTHIKVTEVRKVGFKSLMIDSLFGLR